MAFAGPSVLHPTFLDNGAQFPFRGRELALSVDHNTF